MSKKLLLLLLVFGTANCKLYSQKHDLGKVTKTELLEKRNPNDTTAAATILFKKAKTTFKYVDGKGFLSMTDFFIKVKIYKKEGFDWANFEIPYYVGYETLEKESITINSAFTYNLEDDKIVKEKVTSEGKFKERINEFWESKSITFPNVKEGSIIELRYQLKSENISELPDFQYQYKIPVNYAEYVSEIPEFYLYKGIKAGFVELNVDQKIENASQAINNSTAAGTTKYLEYRQIKSEYKAENIPALIEEEYVNNINNYYGKLSHELMTIRYPDEQPKQMATTWENVAKTIYLEKKFGDELAKYNYYLNDLERIIANVDSQKERMDKVFLHVKNTLNWNGRNGYFAKDGVEEAYKNKVGNAAEVNLILVSMLKMAGIEAMPVLISTRSNGIALFPNRSQFNFVIAKAEIDGKSYLMDATNKNSTVNVLPIRDLNWEGRAINSGGQSVAVDLMPKDNSVRIVNVLCGIDKEGQVKGKLKEQYAQYQALFFKDKYGDNALENFVEKTEAKYGRMAINNCVVTNPKDQQTVSVNYDFESSNLVDVIGDKMYFSPLLFFAVNENPFKSSKREYPVDFMFPNEEKYLINIELPDGYVVESLPKSVSIPMSDNLMSFKYLVANNGNKIQFSLSVSTNSALIPAEYYEELKTVYTEIVKKETEKIVLKKV